ncbi:hypothetical protein N0V93_001858 [Gnomoniopsis smithogilvyi]|uniref:Uncharacterized protein n=1 Tax=Gnomoniopsis smithogilvyi TaxID=1191159 RepID=A0A9W9D306_9PEZI|nr:hypothetical protein N0V93_001858 [Gnomoniopsis smithogilvyi]
MDTQIRSRPSLEVRTNYREELADGLPRAVFRTHRTPLPVPSPLTAKPLPSPIQPSTPGFDIGMRHHERAMVESLDGGSRQGSFSGEVLSGRALSPISERAMAARVGNLSMDGPSHAKSAQLPSTAPNTPSNAQYAPQSGSQRLMVDETRSMLLSGMTVSQANHLGTVANRRLSAPADVLQKSRRQSLALLQPDMLQAWGHVYYNEPAKADVLVAASASRRQSGVAMADGTDGNCVVIRARIRPRNKDRKPFLIARSFDLSQLRTTLPSTPTTPNSLRRQSGVPVSPDDLSMAARTPTTPLTPLTPRLGPVQHRRLSLAAAGFRSGCHPSKSNAKEMPVHLAYARSYLPALAALMMSGHIKTGDSIDLPMPHPEAWPQTLAYVYTGSGELTEAARQNILHLGGRV